MWDSNLSSATSLIRIYLDTRIVSAQTRTWLWTKARSHITNVFDELTTRLVGSLGHSSQFAECSFHNDILNANMEPGEGEDLNQRVLCDLVFQKCTSRYEPP